MYYESYINNVNFATSVLPKRKVAGSELYSNIETQKDSASRRLQDLRNAACTFEFCISLNCNETHKSEVIVDGVQSQYEVYPGAPNANF